LYRLTTFICTSRRHAGQAEIPDVTIELPDFVAQCGCKIEGGTITTLGGAVGDYAGNLSDPSPSASGNSTALQQGGNGTGVLIAVRPVCREGRPSDWIDKIRLAELTDGASNTLLAGELHVPYGKVGQFPDDSPLYNGEHFYGMLRVVGVGIPLASSPRDPIASRFSFGSWHPQVCHFSLADGSVRPISTLTSSSILGALASRNDGSGLENGL
jgi:hypothetical protein